MRVELKSLTSLRGIAAIAVVAMHFSATMQSLSSGNFPSLAPHGSLAVDVFFVLSGFIMAYTYLQSFQTQPLRAAYRSFLAKRAARILPLNIVVTILILVVGSVVFDLWGLNLFHIRPGQLFEDFATNALMLPGLGVGTSINWPAWSVSVEFVAYLLFPVLLALTIRSRPAIAILTCLVAVAALVFVSSMNNGFSPAGGLHNHPWPWRDLVRCLTEFCFGLIVFRVYASGRVNATFERDSVVYALVAATIVLLGAKVGELFAALLFPALILALSLNTGRVSAILASSVPHFLGRISYSLYLVHESFRGVAELFVRSLHPAPLSPALGLMFSAVWACAMVLPAWLAFVFIEQPGRTLLRTVLTRGAARAAAGDDARNTSRSGAKIDALKAKERAAQSTLP